MKQLTTLLLLFLLTLVNAVAQDDPSVTGNSTTYPTPDCNCSGNVLSNGSFEDWTNNKPNNWTFVALTNPAPNQRETSTFSISQDHDVCGSDNGVMYLKGYFYQDVPMENKFTATLNIWGGYHNKVGQKFQLIFLDANKNQVGSLVEVALNKSVSDTPKTEEHGMTKYTLTATANDPTIKFVRVLGKGDGDYFKVDQACLVLTPPAVSCTDCATNKLKNPSFEETVTNSPTKVKDWVGTSNFISDAGYVKCGSKNGLINNGAGSFYQDVDALPSSAVSLKIWGGYHSYSGHKFELIFYSKAGVEKGRASIPLDRSVEELSNQLKQYTLTATAPAETAYVRVQGIATGNYFKVDYACLTITGGTVLPVVLTNFDVSKEQKSANLAWSTVSETNSREFEVQHSGDGKQWSVLGTVEAKGESKALVRYNYTHLNPSAGNNLYRLKMIDADDTFAFSKIVNLNFEGEGISIFPNPTSDRITLSMNGNIKNVKLYTLNGAVVMDTVPDSSNGINVTRLAQGSYVVNVYKLDGTVTSRRIQIVR